MEAERLSPSTRNWNTLPWLAYSPRRVVLSWNLNFLRTGRKLLLISCVFCLRKTFKSVNPKILRIGRQKRKNDFFLIWPKEPFGYLFSEMASKGSISFSFLRNLQNLKIRPQGLQQRPWDLKFDTCLTCSYGRTKRCLNMSFTWFVGHLLNLTRD